MFQTCHDDQLHLYVMYLVTSVFQTCHDDQLHLYVMYLVTSVPVQAMAHSSGIFIHNNEWITVLLQ